MVVGSNLARGKIFTASIGSFDSIYLIIFIYHMHQTVVCHLYPWIHQTFTCELKYAIHCKGTDIGHLLHQWWSISALPEHPSNGDVSVAQLVASMSGVVLGVVVMVVGSNLIRGKLFTASIGSVDSIYLSIFIYCMNLHQFVIL